MNLLEAAFLHAKFWEGDLRLAGELRARVAKFGATVEDRLKLRIQFASTADIEGRVIDREERRGRISGGGSRSRASTRLKNLEGSDGSALEASRRA